MPVNLDSLQIKISYISCSTAGRILKGRITHRLKMKKGGTAETHETRVKMRCTAHNNCKV